MIRYITETNKNESNSINIFCVDDEYNIKSLVAVVFDKAHAHIIKRKLNEYVAEKKAR